MENAEESIPQQREGTQVTVEDSVTLRDEEEAKTFFCTVKNRLLDIHRWKDMAGALSAGFSLTNEQGQEIDTAPRPGNYFKINIPAPGILTGEGYDWVRVEEVEEGGKGDCEFLTMRVRPVTSPLNDREDVAHFLTDEATSNFIVQREGITVTAGVYGRNEKPNVEAETLLDKARNAIVGSGAVTGLAKVQWQWLVKGLLENK